MTKIPSLPYAISSFFALLPDRVFDSLTTQMHAVLDEIQIRRRRFDAALTIAAFILDTDQAWDFGDCPADLADSIDELGIETDRGLPHVANILACEIAELDDLEDTTKDYLSDVESVEGEDADPDAAAEEAA